MSPTQKPKAARQAAWQKRYLDARARGLNVSAGAAQAGITRGQVHRLRKSDPAFAEAEIEAEAMAIGVMEDALFEAARGGNTTLMMFWLQNRAPDIWRDRRNTNPANANTDDEDDIDKQIRELLDELAASKDADDSQDPQA